MAGVVLAAQLWTLGASADFRGCTHPGDSR
jgi:hypothetical protein